MEYELTPEEDIGIGLILAASFISYICFLAYLTALFNIVWIFPIGIVCPMIILGYLLLKDKS